MRFLSLLAAAGTAMLAVAAPSSEKKSKRATKLKFFGVNESGAEFGTGNIPGVYNTDYTWYDLSTIDTFIAKGMNTFRINFLMERLIPNTLTGPANAAYLGNLTATVNYITSRGAYAMITPHNYGRYYNNIITDTAGFQAFWKTLATPYKGNSKVIFDTNNEYHDMSQTLVVQLNQAAINGIRAAGATSQYITPEGNAYTGAWTWTNTKDATTGQTNGQTMGALTDSANKIIYQMHQYLDSDGSGTSATCVNSTIFANRLVDATNWLRANKKQGIIGEYAGGNNAACITALTGGLAYLAANSDVWTGALWWAAGPWWGDYIYTMEPPSGVAYTAILPSLIAAE